MDGDEETKKKLLDSKEKMFEGESFSKVIKETQIYSPLHARMIMIAERTGETDQALSKIAVQVDEEVTAEIQNFVSVIEPTMVIILSILVGALLLSVMMPLMSDQLQDRSFCLLCRCNPHQLISHRYLQYDDIPRQSYYILVLRLPYPRLL